MSQLIKFLSHKCKDPRSHPHTCIKSQVRCTWYHTTGQEDTQEGHSIQWWGPSSMRPYVNITWREIKENTRVNLWPLNVCAHTLIHMYTHIYILCYLAYVEIHIHKQWGIQDLYASSVAEGAWKVPVLCEWVIFQSGFLMFAVRVTVEMMRSWVRKWTTVIS